MLLYYLWTIGAPSAQGSTQRPFSLLLPGVEPRQWQYQHGVPLNDVGHPDPPNCKVHIFLTVLFTPKARFVRMYDSNTILDVCNACGT